jgi:hypothetical protein
MPFVRTGRRLLALTALGLSFFVTRPLLAEVEAEEVVLEEEDPSESGDDPTTDEGADSDASTKFEWPRRKVVLYARQGLMLYGPGQRVTERCTGGSCPVERVDYTQAFSLQPGFDVLLHASNSLRLGLGFTYSGVEVAVERFDQDDDVYSLGSEIAIPFSIEYVVRAGQEVAFPLRFQPSLLFVFPGKVSSSDTCEDSVGLTNCVYRQKPYPGFLAGVSGGVLWNLAPVGLRADAAVQYVYETATAWEARNMGTQTDDSQYRAYQGLRFLLQVGFEI